MGGLGEPFVAFIRPQAIWTEVTPLAEWSTRYVIYDEGIDYRELTLFSDGSKVIRWLPMQPAMENEPCFIRVQ